MNCKGAVALALAISMLQVTSANVPSPRGGILGGIIEKALKEAEAIVEQVEQVVENIIQQVLGQIENAVGQVENAGAGIVDKADENLQQSYDKINSTVEQMIAEAEDIGADISQCIAEEIEAEDTFPGENGDFGSCVSEEAGNTEQLVGVAQQGIQDAKQFVQNAQDALSLCIQAPLTAVLCLSTHATQTATEVVHIVTDLGHAGQAVAQKVSDAATSIGSCVKNKVQGVENQAQQIAQDVSSCVSKKIGKS